MPLLNVIIALIILGVVLYLIQILEIDARIKNIIHILIIAVVVIYLLRLLLGGGILDMRIG